MSNTWAGYEASRSKSQEGKGKLYELVLSTGQRFNDADYPVDDSGLHICSIKNIQAIAAEHDVVAIFLSIGGNDVYLRPDIQMDLVRSLIPCRGHLRQKVADEFSERYSNLLVQLRLACPNATIVPTIPYHPHRSFGLMHHTQKSKTAKVARLAQWLLLSRLVTPMIKRMLGIAKAMSLPVIDLSRTFDPENATHYGSGVIGEEAASGASWSGAEPSNVSNRLTAQLIAHIYHELCHGKEGAEEKGEKREKRGKKGANLYYIPPRGPETVHSIPLSDMDNYRFGVLG